MCNIRIIEVNNIGDAQRQIRKIGATQESVDVMAAKAIYFTIKIENISPIAANILKQEILSKGGDAAVNKGCINLSVDSTDVLLMGTYRQLNQLIDKLKLQPFGLTQIANQLKRVIDLYKYDIPVYFNCADNSFILGEKTYLMSVLNIHSLSDCHQVVKQIEYMHKKGTDIIEITWECDTDRDFIFKVLNMIHKYLSIPMCISVYNHEYLEDIVHNGVSMFNFVLDDDNFIRVCKMAAKNNVSIIIVHAQPVDMNTDIISQIYNFIKCRAKIALDAGIKKDNIIIDPGIGLCKNAEQSMEILRRLKEFRSLGYPIMVGASYQPLAGKPHIQGVSDCIEHIAAVAAIAVCRGADFIRFKGTADICTAAQIADAIMRN